MFKFFSSFKNVVYFVLVLASALLAVTYLYLMLSGKIFEFNAVNLIFRDKTQTDCPETHPEPAKKNKTGIGSRETAPSKSFSDAPQSRSGNDASPPGEVIYSWMDESGVKHFSDSPPPDTQKNYEVTNFTAAPDAEVTTAIIIDGNRLLVPVEVSYNGSLASIWLALDTGATTTVIHHTVADELNIAGTEPVKNTVADGSVIDTRKGFIEHILVGPYKMDNFEVVIIDYKGRPDVSDGLLGMNFLRNVDYTIDYSDHTITWSRKRL